ncbi:MAG: 2OG-Fe(II) oxygenase family protein [Pseudomonadota bacterium]
METVPAIDLAPLAEGPDPTTEAAVAETLAGPGGFHAIGFAGAEMLEAQLALMTAFFALPRSARMALAQRKHVAANANIYRGYTPPPTKPHWSYNQIFDIGPEPPLPAPDLPSQPAFEEANVWPEEAALPGWRAAMLGYAETCRVVAQTVVAAAARALGADASALRPLTHGRNHTLRLLHYPEIPPDFTLLEADGSLRPTRAESQRTIAREHIDTGILSVLWQDGEGGLEMQGRDGIWRAVPPRPGALSIHCGDLLEPVLGPTLAPTRHRVIGGERARASVGFFLEPDFCTEILVPGGERKTYGRHLTDQFPARFQVPA